MIIIDTEQLYIQNHYTFMFIQKLTIKTENLNLPSDENSLNFWFGLIWRSWNENEEDEMGVGVTCKKWER